MCVKNFKLCATLINFNKKEPFRCILPKYFNKKGEDQKKGLCLLKVHIFTELYVLLYTLYLHLSNTTHHYSLKFYEHT